jgi:hypothetical protein
MLSRAFQIKSANRSIDVFGLRLASVLKHQHAHDCEEEHVEPGADEPTLIRLLFGDCRSGEDYHHDGCLLLVSTVVLS